MKRFIKCFMAAILAVSMVAVNLTPPVFAEVTKSGWVYDTDDSSWYYYEKDGTPRTNNFAFNNVSASNVWNAYYLGEDGRILYSDGGTSVMGPNGEFYELTPFGAVKGGQLGSSYDDTAGEYFVWYTDPTTGQLSCGTWRYLNDNGSKYWYYFAQLNGSKKGIGTAMIDQNKKIAGSWYHFDTEGHMVSSEFVDIGSEGDVDYRAYAQLMGDYAVDKWLFIEGNWYYFKNKSIGDSDRIIPVAVTGIQTIDGKTYEFETDGSLVSEYTPYRSVESVDISADSEEIYLGESANINVDIKLATASEATPASPSEATPVASPSEASPSEATPDITPINHPATPDMSADEMQALISGKVYDIYLQYNGHTGEGVVIPVTPSIKNGKLNYKFTPKVTGDTELNCYIDGKLSNTVTISCENDPEKKGNASYIKSSISGILNSQLPSEEVVQRLNETYGEMDLDTATSLRDDNESLSELETFEKMYAAGQGLDVFKTDTDAVKDVVKSSSVKVVGAYLNADVNADAVTLSMDKSTEDVSHIEADKKVSLDIDLKGGNIDSSSLAIPVTITMPIPSGLSKDGLKLYHIHDGVTTDMKLSSKELSNGNVRFTTDSFSTFVFAGKSEDSKPIDNNDSDHSGGSGSSSSGFNVTSKTIPETGGNWKLTDLGWTFLNPAGELYKNTWIYVKNKWYWIESSGVMATGWKELKGKKYYLNTINGDMHVGWILIGDKWYYAGEDGAIKTGWVEVNNKWYYFTEDGSMLSSTTTPDGHTVNVDGERVK